MKNKIKENPIKRIVSAWLLPIMIKKRWSHIPRWYSYIDPKIYKLFF